MDRWKGRREMWRNGKEMEGKRGRKKINKRERQARWGDEKRHEILMEIRKNGMERKDEKRKWKVKGKK